MRRTLIVEDDPAILTCLAEVFRERGRKVLLAENGKSAMQQMRTYAGEIEALITDHHLLHGLDGADLIMHLRQTSPEIPIVLVTGDPTAVSEEWRRRYRVQLVTKPLRVSDLLDALQNPPPPLPEPPLPEPP